jgi:hypothetical protein
MRWTRAGSASTSAGKHELGQVDLPVPQAGCAPIAIALVHSDNRAAAAIAMGIFATGVAVFVLLIASHDRAFNGEICVKPNVLLQVRPE